MSPTDIRILFLADSHLGFDLPARPRAQRRRRGHDFLANHAAALRPALNGEADIVVHGGDVFDRPRVHEALAWQALRPLVQIANAGVPVFIVPGNHERARIPHARFAMHPLIHIFDRPRTFAVDVRGQRIALSGFPFQRRDVRSRFSDLIEQSEWHRTDADVRMLCMHQCAEGATVGPADYTFTTADDVVRVRDVPDAFAAVLSGHIHRHQVLTADLRGRTLPAPVLYPGSIERTSLAEIGERKGWMMLHVARDADITWEFRELPARPMLVRDLDLTGLSARALDAALRGIISEAPNDAVLRVRITGRIDGGQLRVLRASHVRSFVPDTMNLEISGDFGPPYVAPARATRAKPEPPATAPQPQLDLGIP